MEQIRTLFKGLKVAYIKYKFHIKGVYPGTLFGDAQRISESKYVFGGEFLYSRT